MTTTNNQELMKQFFFTFFRASKNESLIRSEDLESRELSLQVFNIFISS